MSVRILAEPGSTAEGDLDRFRRLIEVAAAAGATAFKNQWTSNPAGMCERRRAPNYLAAYQRIAYPIEWHAQLRTWCHQAGLEYACAVYLREDIQTIAPFVDFFKVSSFDAGDHDFLRAHLPYGKPILVSTGMAEGMPVVVDDPAAAPGIQRVINDRFTWLQCVSAYPCPANQANLAVLHDWALTGIEGYSDHTATSLTGGLAVAAGASILEVHVRLEDTDPANPDYATALTPQGLRDYVDFARLAEVMLGDGVKKPQPAEAAMQPYRVVTP